MLNHDSCSCGTKKKK
uniref:Uncharacterized protein n=1 Tax=Anguilla anguilla TaxID=7936 RepID=A0A0E9VUC7_ANGAN